MAHIVEGNVNDFEQNVGKLTPADEIMIRDNDGDETAKIMFTVESDAVATNPCWEIELPVFTGYIERASYQPVAGQSPDSAFDFKVTDEQGNEFEFNNGGPGFPVSGAVQMLEAGGQTHAHDIMVAGVVTLSTDDWGQKLRGKIAVHIRRNKDVL